MEVLYQILAGLGGVWLYTLMTLWSNKEMNKITSFAYWGTIKYRWLGAILLIGTLSGLIHFIPQSGTLIHQLTGLDVEASLTAFLSLGYIFGSSSRKVVAREKDEKSIE